MYSVAWDNLALTMLAAIWTIAPDQAAVTAAADTIDRLLTMNPLVHGVPVCEGLYAIEVAPLRALFEVDAPAGVVTVVSVSRLP